MLLRSPQTRSVDLGSIRLRLTAVGAINGKTPLNVKRWPAEQHAAVHLVGSSSGVWFLKMPLSDIHTVPSEVLALDLLQGSDVPVPTLVADAQPGASSGYLVRRTPGRTVHEDAEVALVPKSHRHRLSVGFIDTLAAIHVHKPAGYDRLPVASAADLLTRLGMGLMTHGATPQELRLLELLERTRPPGQRASLVHGDYRLGNVVIDSERPERILAVENWEFAQVGDPLTDLAIAATYWSTRPTSAVAARPAAHEGFPQFDDLVDRYSGSTGIDVEDLWWHRALAGLIVARRWRQSGTSGIKRRRSCRDTTAFCRNLIDDSLGLF